MSGLLHSLSHAISPTQGERLRLPQNIPPSIKATQAVELLAAQASPSSNVDRYKYTCSALLGLPVASGTLFLLSSGSNGGSVNLNAGGTLPDTVQFTVTIYYNEPGDLDDISICPLSKGDDSLGVGIFTPSPWYVNPQPLFSVNVAFPGHSNLPARNFEIDTGKYDLDIGDLRPAVAFASFLLSAAQGGISSKSVFSKNIAVKTTQGSIKGSYSSSSAVSLVTEQGGISADVSLEAPAAESTVALNVTNAHGNAYPNLTLVSKSEEGSGGIFDIKVKAPHGNIDTTIVAAPIDSTVKLVISAEHGNAAAALHPTFEGAFSLTTSNGVASLSQTHVTDPTGQGRKRDVESSKSSNGRDLSGTAYWIPTERTNPVGNVKIQNATGKVSLTV